MPYEGPSHKAIPNLRKLIEEQKNTYNWQFLYLGTNYDAINAGVKLGINKESCLNYSYSERGAQNAMNVCRKAMNRIQTNNYDGFTLADQKEAMDG
jgi:Zn-finger domain-containing protein